MLKTHLTTVKVNNEKAHYRTKLSLKLYLKVKTYLQLTLTLKDI